METNREELLQIKEVLKQNPRGMNVIEIARAIDMHRQSVTKYVEMLVVSGQVEMKSFGPSKVYYLSQRLPVSAMLSLSSDMILLLDRDLKIINVNDAFLAFAGAKRDDVINKEVRLLSLSLEFNPPIEPFINDALKGKESKIEALFQKNGREQFYNVKFIPVVFDDGLPGATIIFENVTEQKKAARENEKLFLQLKESERRFRTLIQNLKSGVMLVEADGKFSIHNPAFLQMFDLTEEHMERMSITSGDWESIEVFDSDGRPLARGERPSIKAFATGQPVKDLLIGFRRKADDSIVWALVNVAVRKSEGGRVDKLICTYYDITERKLREEQIARLTRLYATLSRVNEAIVRIRDEGTLFAEVCRIVMEEGGFPLVWIGQVQGRQVVPVARSGQASAYLDEVRIEVQGELGAGPTGTCIREGRAVVNDDFAVNQKMLPWQTPARRYGFRASASFPLYRKGQVCGAFTLYACEPGVFDAEQVSLLLSLSSDVSKALDDLEYAQYHAKAEQALRANEERLRRSQAIAHLGSWELDRATGALTWSDEVCRIFGLQPEKSGATYEAFLAAVHPDDRAAVDAAFVGSVRDGRDTYEIEHRVVMKRTGEVRVVYEKGEHVRNESGEIVRTVGTVQDVTDRRRAEDELARAKEQVAIYLDLLDNDISNMHQIALGQLELARESMAEKGRLEGDEIEMIRLAIESLARSTRLIENAHKLNRLNRLAPALEIVDLDRLLKEAIAELPAAAGREITVSRTPARNRRVKANPLLKDIFRSLICHAIGRADGRVAVDIGIRKVDLNGTRCYNVTIEADGPGILDEKMAAPIRQGSPEADGLVMGQDIIAAILESYGGRVRSEDRVHGDHARGTRFVVDLPVAERNNGR